MKDQIEELGRSILDMVDGLGMITLFSGRFFYWMVRRPFRFHLLTEQLYFIGNKSILEQLQFDENDYISMVKDQRELIQRLQEKLDNVEEENRQLHVRLSNQNKN